MTQSLRIKRRKSPNSFRLTRRDMRKRETSSTKKASTLSAMELDQLMSLPKSQRRQPLMPSLETIRRQTQLRRKAQRKWVEVEQDVN